MQTRNIGEITGGGGPVPRVVVGGTHSGVGKTTVATALMVAFTRRGLRVQAFKVGPDFIDPGFHEAATGRPSHNLDGWMLSRAANEDIYARAAEGADLVIVEGVMGLFDGYSGTQEAGSTAEMAKWLDAPVVLVVDAAAMARSGAAMVHGYATFDPGLTLGGVIFNRVNGAGHYRYLREAVEVRAEAEALGFLSDDAAIRLPERHLGLELARTAATPRYLDALVAWVNATVDLERVLRLAASAGSTGRRRVAPDARVATQARIGVARDSAFCFYYEENLSWLRRHGAELVTFSPLGDASLPQNLDGLYLGGGYPELFAERLSANDGMRASVREFAAGGGPVYAECGGLMYLTDAIVDSAGRSFSMAGVFPTCARMQARVTLGYTEVEITTDWLWLRGGERLRGHQFRYSSIDAMPACVGRAYCLVGNTRKESEGYTSGAVLGSYVHLHFGACPDFARRFVATCAAHAQKRLNPTL